MSLPAALVFFVALALLVAGGLAGPTAWVVLRRARAMRRPFPAAWREVLRRRMPLYAELSAATQRRLEQRVQVLLAELPFIGCGGLVVSAEMRVLIAAQAALLLLERGGGFGTLRQVLLYPGAFVVDRAEPGAGGVVHEARRALAGESWQQGQVVLAWDAVQAGAAEPHDGANVVIHEFAHKLDMENGAVDGIPRLPDDMTRTAWIDTFASALEDFQSRVDAGEDTLLDPYAAEDPAEFFAVMSEAFFQTPGLLRHDYPAVYEQLQRFYRQTPLG